APPRGKGVARRARVDRGEPRRAAQGRHAPPPRAPPGAPGGPRALRRDPRRPRRVEARRGGPGGARPRPRSPVTLLALQGAGSAPSLSSRLNATIPPSVASWHRGVVASRRDKKENTVEPREGQENGDARPR